MKYDFETVLDRRGKDSLAADVIPFDGVEPDEGVSRIPMWVADMSFAVAPSIKEAMQRRLENPCWGYYSLTDEYYNAIIDWQRERNGVEGLTSNEIGYENGVLGGVASAVCAFTVPGEKILLHSPTYVGFTGTLERLGRKIVHSPLKQDENGVWRMDYEDMDAKLKEHGIHLAIFCSPHNPCGRVWERDEIERALEVYRKNDCVVISDEIWSDIILGNNKHIPTQSVSEDARRRVMAFYAPSKTFSLAGLIGSYHIVFDPFLRARLRRQAELSGYNHCNVMSMHALIGAYTQGGEWADEMCAVVEKNLNYACDFFAEHMPEVTFMRPQGTYMLLIDCKDWCEKHGVSMDELLHRGIRAGVIWQSGAAFNAPFGIRMNFALPFSLAKEAMDRLKNKVFV